MPPRPRPRRPAALVAGVAVALAVLGGCAPSPTSPTTATGATAVSRTSNGAGATGAAAPGATAPASGAPTTNASATNGVIERVVDGDTVIVRLGGRRERVRLIGIDTPETKDPRRPVQCFGKEASAFTTGLLPAGTPVRLERDVELRDRYGRLLAYVYRADGVFVNLALAREGYARLLTYPPNVAHVDEFREAVTVAREAGRGLWQACGEG